MRRHQRRRRFLDHLLMPALHGTFALAQMHHVAVMVAEDLDLDVARVFDQLLDVNAAVAESAQRFARCGFESGRQIFCGDPRGACPCRRRPRRPSA
jgi:hypothetical protein